ncbi:MAG TPA: hypothetical protein VGJ94_05710 [Syntrophorhabdaceae bacterium]
MKGLSEVLLCGCVICCLLLPIPGNASDTVEGKQIPAVAEKGKKEKETSLYLYYQRYLNPYFSKSQPRTADRSKGTESKASLVSNPTFLPAHGSKDVNLPAAEKEAPSEAKKEDSADKPYIMLNRLDSIGLDELNKSFPQAYRKEYLAELALGFKLTPLVDLSVGKVQKFERSGDSPWGAHDDGWRIRLQKNF